MKLSVRSALLMVTALAAPTGLHMTTAMAQQVTPPGPGKKPAVAGNPHVSGIEDVTVTSQRRRERLQDVPIAVTAVTNAQLSRYRIDNASRLQLLAPGLTWAQRGSDSVPAIRGVRTALTGSTNDPAIGFYVDGVYQSRTQQTSFPFFDVNRVEVQRGPQGTLYGRNTFGGNISVITNEPTKQYEGAINSQLGNYNLRQVDGYVNIPINDKVQLRIAGDHIGHDGYVRSSTTPGVTINDDDENAARVSLKVTPTEDLEILLHAGYWHRQDNGGGSYGYRVAGTLINPATGKQSVYGVPVSVNPTVHNGSDFIHGVDVGVPITGDKWTNQWDYKPVEDLEEDYVSSQVNYNLGPVVLHSITGYTKFRANRSADLDQSSIVFPAPGVTSSVAGSGVQDAHTFDEALSQEFQVSSRKTYPLQYIFGAYILHDRIAEPYYQDYTAKTATALSTANEYRINTMAYAGYGQASYSIIPHQLSLIAGGRFSDETKRSNISNYTAPAGTVQFRQVGADVSNAPRFDRWTWRGGLEYTPTRNNMFYATASTGFESGGVNNNSTNSAIPGSFAPEKIQAYEIGTKNRFFMGRLQVNASLFYNDMNNLQITILDQRTNLSYVSSAGAGNSKGAEFEVQVIPIENLHLTGNVVFLDAKYTDYMRPNDFYSATNGDPRSVSLAGKTIPQSPKVQATISGYYDIKLGRLGTVSPFFALVHSSSYYTTDYNTSLDRQNSYDTLDLNVRWTSANEKYYVEMFGNNVGNVPVLYATLIGSGGRMQQAFGNPAVWGAQLGAKF